MKTEKYKKGQPPIPNPEGIPGTQYNLLDIYEGWLEEDYKHGEVPPAVNPNELIKKVQERIKKQGE